MTNAATLIAPAARAYSGGLTRPERWASWEPRKGDIIVCTPPKCGTTWTQTILTMLVHGSTNLPESVQQLSPWIDADFGIPASDIVASLNNQKNRRVVKTHTPADGFPIWEGVSVISVYRHPLDTFFSLRKHIENTANPNESSPLGGPVSTALAVYLSKAYATDDHDENSLEGFKVHFQQTVQSGRLPNLKLFHYSDMVRDGRQTVQALAKVAKIEADETLIDIVTESTAFGAMRANAKNYAPAGGTGFWKSDANFFESGSSKKWQGNLSDAELESFSKRFENLVPDRKARTWLEQGNAE